MSTKRPTPKPPPKPPKGDGNRPDAQTQPVQTQQVQPETIEEVIEEVKRIVIPAVQEPIIEPAEVEMVFDVPGYTPPRPGDKVARWYRQHGWVRAPKRCREHKVRGCLCGLAQKQEQKQG